MAISTNVHLCAERGVSLSSQVRAHPRHANHPEPWYAISVTVATEGDLSAHEVAYYISSKQLEGFAQSFEDLALKMRAMADEAAKVQRPPLSPFAQSIVRTVTAATQDMMEGGIGSGLPDDVRERAFPSSADVEQRR